jgi:hypothetical protein
LLQAFAHDGMVVRDEDADGVFFSHCWFGCFT